MTDFDFLLCETDVATVVADVESDIGPELAAFWKHTGAYDRIVAYLAECKLACIDTTLIHAAHFTGLASNPVLVPKEPSLAHYLTDPLQLGPGDIDRLVSLVASARLEKVA